MTPNLTLILVAGALISCGVYLVTERSLSRILMGVLLLSNGVNVLFLVAAGDAGLPAFTGESTAETATDPLPQAMVLTAIVISMAVAAFVMTLAYRSFQLFGHDEVQDDREDARIRALAEKDQVSSTYEDARFHDTGEDVVSE